VLLHDSQFTREEYMQRRGWGHSSMEDAVAFACLAGVQRLLLSHHDPDHSDSFLERMFSSFKRDSDSVLALTLAKEGLQFELS
jgi:ribonuclease BN (tRNA processing enzyme)